MSSGIPSSGELSIQRHLNPEVDQKPTDTFNMDGAKSRELGNKPTPKSNIKFSDYRGRIWRYDIVISTSQWSTFDVRNFAVNNGWNQVSRLYITVKSGVVVEGNPALYVAGSFPNGVYLNIESGAIVRGKGGNGGRGIENSHGGVRIDSTPGATGGNAIQLGGSNQPAFTCYISNYGYVAGGGGGGGGGAANHRKHHNGNGGSGGGGGVPYGVGGVPGLDTAYGRWGDYGGNANDYAVGIGGRHGLPRGGGNGGYLGNYGEWGAGGADGKWYAVGEPKAGGAMGAYISGGKYVQILAGVTGSNFVGSYVY